MLLKPNLAPVAHPGLPLTQSWTVVEVPVALGIVLITTVYLYAVGPLRQRYRWAERVERRQVTYFLLAMTILFASLQGPLHVLSDTYLLTAHMLQHMLITLLVPPLLLKSLPSWLIDRLLLVPLYLRRSLRRQWRSRLTDSLPRGPFLLRIGRVVTSPVVAFITFNVVLLLWHIPAYYEATLTDDTVHSLMHTMFIATAILTWWPVYSPTEQLPALSDPLQMLYLFFQSIPSTVLGAIIALANVILYPTYAAAPRISMSVRDDQQVAGLLMWVIGGFFFLVLITIRWFRWMGLDEDEATKPVSVST